MPFLLIVFLWSFSIVAQAESMTVANTHWPPWRILKNDGHLKGIEIDILERLSEQLGLSLETKGCGWKRCLKHMEVGESDVMTGLQKTPEREQYMTFIEPPYRTIQSICFYTNKASAINIRNYDDLRKLTIGVIQKVAYFEPFNNDQKIKKHGVTTGDNLLRLVEGNKIDAFVNECLAGDNFIKEKKLSRVIKRTEYVHSEVRPIYLAISNKSPLLKRKNEISNELKKMLDTGEIAKIIESYGLVDVE